MADGDNNWPAAAGRPVSSQPYRGPTRTRRSDGQREIWVEGRGYVPEHSLDALPTNERQAVLDANAAAQGANAALGQFNRFEQLNRVQGTGSVFDRLGRMANIRPLLPDTELDEMWAIQDRLTPGARQGLPGPASNLDVSMFRGSLPSTANTPAANTNIIGGLRDETRALQGYAEFLNWYAGENRTTNGAQEQWNAYQRDLASVPRAQRSQMTWRQYFGIKDARPRAGRGVEPSARRETPAGSGAVQQYDAQGNRIR